MAKLYIIIFSTLVLQSIAAVLSSKEGLAAAVEDTPIIGQADTNSNSKLYINADAATINEDKGQRKKRFYDYFDFDFPPIGPYGPSYSKRDDSQDTGVPGAQDFMMQILRRVQTILSYTRQRAFSPPLAHYPVPSFVPFYYIPRGVCDCTPADTPNNGEDTSNNARPTQPTTTSPPADSTTQGISPLDEGGPSPTDDTNKTTPDFSSRLPDMDDDEEDGSRPISFVPVRPKTPLKRPPPPVDHGTVQASSGDDVKKTSSATTEASQVITSLPPQADLPTISIPTLCDGAVLMCCHQAEVTYECFKTQGCPYPTSPENPCDENLILRVIGKFQNYYANRRG